VDLKRHLLLRVSLFALVIGLAAGAIVLQQAVARIGTHIQRTGNTVERLIAGEADQTRDAFRRSLDGMALASLDGIGPLLGICVAVDDIYKRPVIQRCFHAGGEAPAAVRWLLAGC
jgi:two-component system sensor histidine kinase UhpB